MVIAQSLEGHYSTTAEDSQELIYLLIHLSICLSHVPKYEHKYVACCGLVAKSWCPTLL